jgi:hypothetical protein
MFYVQNRDHLELEKMLLALTRIHLRYKKSRQKKKKKKLKLMQVLWQNFPVLLKKQLFGRHYLQ